MGVSNEKTDFRYYSRRFCFRLRDQPRQYYGRICLSDAIFKLLLSAIAGRSEPCIGTRGTGNRRSEQ